LNELEHADLKGHARGVAGGASAQSGCCGKSGQVRPPGVDALDTAERLFVWTMPRSGMIAKTRRGHCPPPTGRQRPSCQPGTIAKPKVSTRPAAIPCDGKLPEAEWGARESARGVPGRAASRWPLDESSLALGQFRGLSPRGAISRSPW